jgi:hypothetical protein
VSNEKRPLFETNRDLFQKILLNDDKDKRFASISTPDDLLLCEMIRYGIYNKQEMIRPLVNLYTQLLAKIPEEGRHSIYEHVVWFIENTSVVSINAFLPFIGEDTATSIVSRAVIDYVSLGPLSHNDPMSRVKDVVGMIKTKMLKNEGAAFGALLHIGDKRVCDLLISVRDHLDRDAMNNAVNCGTGFIHSATVEFYLDWLEGMEGADHDDAFGIVASGLALLRMKSQVDEVATGHRPFPARAATPEQWKASLKPIPLSTYLQTISRRMYALERSEPPPRIMPRVLTEWGLEPLTDRAEVTLLDDRAATATAQLGDEAAPNGRIVDVEREWWDGEGRIYLAWGILNPNGPTLYLLGSRAFEGKHRTFMRWLHMFGGGTTYAAEAVDEITYRRVYDDAMSIHEHLLRKREDGLFHIIPSFLISNGGDKTFGDIAKVLLARGAASKTDWGRPMAYVRQFGRNFFASAGAELREAYEKELAEARAKGEKPSEALEFMKLLYGNNPDFRDAKLPSWKAAPMTTELLEEWWRIVSPREFQIEAFATLKEMWEGASDMPGVGSVGDVVPWERVFGFVKAYGLSFSK